MVHLPNVAIIELGSQYTLLIERTLRELGARSVILDPKRAQSWLKNNPLKAVILSGGASGVYDVDAPQPPAEVVYFAERPKLISWLQNHYKEYLSKNKTADAVFMVIKS